MVKKNITQKSLMDLDGVNVKINSKDITDKYKKPIIPILENKEKIIDYQFKFTCRNCKNTFLSDNENENFCTICKVFLNNINLKIGGFNSLEDIFIFTDIIGINTFMPEHIKLIEEYLMVMNE